MKKIIFAILLTACSLVTKAQSIDSIKIEAAKPPENPPFTSVEQAPEFRGGMERFYQFLAANLRYPKDSWEKKIQGKVFVQMWVRTDGNVDSVKAISGPAEDLNNEAVRVISHSPHWMPGVQNGQAVAVKFVVPVTFAIPKPEPQQNPPAKKP